MRIDGTGRPSSTSPTTRHQGTPSTRFSLDQAGSTPARPQADAIGQAAALAGLTGILALQEVEDPVLKRRRALRRGHSLLDDLEDLRLALIDGTIAPAHLDRMTLTLATREPTADAHLESLLDEIDLRVQVELAKLGRFPPG